MKWRNRRATRGQFSLIESCSIQFISIQFNSIRPPLNCDMYSLVCVYFTSFCRHHSGGCRSGCCLILTTVRYQQLDSETSWPSGKDLQATHCSAVKNRQAISYTPHTIFLCILFLLHLPVISYNLYDNIMIMMVAALISVASCCLCMCVVMP